MVELLVVLGILGISALVAVPAMGRSAASNHISRAVNEFRADLAYTRMLAVRNGTAARISFTSDTLYAVVVDPGGATQRVAKTVRARDAHPALRISGSATTFSFDSRGILTSGAATVAVSRAGVTRRIGITALGGTFEAN